MVKDYLTKKELKEILDNAPEGVTSREIFDSLRTRGVTFEGFEDTEKPFEAPETPTPLASEVPTFMETLTRKLSPKSLLGAEEGSERIDFRKVAGNFLSSGYEQAKNIIGGGIDLIKKPQETSNVFGKLIGSGIANIIPGEQGGEQMAKDAFKVLVTDRYGSYEKFKKTIEEDPVGVIMDFADVTQLVGKTTSTFGKLSKLDDITDIGSTISKIGDTIDPITQTQRAVSNTIDAAKGARITPFKVDPSDFPKETLTDKYGIETLPSQINPSKSLAQIEQVGFGKPQEEILTTMKNKISGIERSASDISAYDANLKKISVTLQKELGDIDVNFKDTKDALYAAARESIAATKKVDVSDYVEYLKEQVKFMQKGKGVQSPALTPFLKELEQFVIRDEAGKITGYNTTMKFDALVSGVENLEAAMVNDPTRLTSNLVGKAKDTLKEVMEGTNFERNMTLAEEAFKKVKDVTESDAFKKLLKNPGDPEYIYKVFPKQSPSMATSIMEIMPKSIIDDVRNVFQRELITEMFKADGVTFKANGVNSVIKKWGASTIEAVIGKDGLKSLQNMQEVESDIIKLKDILKVGEDLGKTPKNVKFVTDLVNKAPGGIFVNVLYNYLDNKLTKKFINTPWVQEILRGGSFKLPDVPSIPFEIDNMSSKTRTLSEILRRKGELEE